MMHNLPISALKDQFTVCLLRPKGSVNVGAVARAMSNLGFGTLSLVAPRELSYEQARGAACWGGEILERASCVNHIEEAVGSMQEVVGFSSSYGKNRGAHLALDEWIESLELGSLPKTALLFGPEETGLHNEDLTHCRVIVRIPSVAENPSYNLAQAVLIVLFELSRKIHSSDTQISKTSDRALWSEFQALDQLIDKLAESSEFYGVQTSEAVPRILKNLFKRTSPTDREMQILLGFFSRLMKSRE